MALTQLIKDFQEVLSHILKTPCISPTIETNPKIHVDINKYISTEIAMHINTAPSTSFTFVDRDGIVVFYTFDKRKPSVRTLQSYYIYIRSILHVCKKYSELSCASPTIKIYLTPFLKTLGKSFVLGPHEINSGYTRVCGYDNTIVVYRAEEWFKVFIHECIHFYGIDFSNVDTNIYVPLLKGIFCIRSDYLLYESYTEFWAEILYLCLHSIGTGIHIEELIQKECMHSVQNCRKILRSMNVQYTDILRVKPESKKNTSIFIENTNVFCYYFLKTLYFYYIKDFLLWNVKNNNTLLAISKNPRVIKDLCKWISIKSHQLEFITLMKYTTNVPNVNKSLKMMYHT
jgi:hypothetical protein